MNSLPYQPNVAGVDEAGRGPIAGPVVVAAVIIPPNYDVTGFLDSKQLSAERRETAFLRITAELPHAIISVPADQVDKSNILAATLNAMSLALIELGAESALIDGNQLPKSLPCPASTLVKGDSKDAAIAAASILAKVTRDRQMVEYSKLYPEYEFDKNKGYGQDSIKKLKEFGPTPIHRYSFEPLKSMTNQPCLTFDE